MNDQRSIRRAVPSMHFAKPRRHVGIESRDEWNARRAAEPRRCDARYGKAQQKRKGRHNPYDTHASGHVADSLHNPLQYVDVAFADGEEQRQCRADIEQAGQNAAPSHGSGQSFLWVFDFVTHDGSELKPNQSETNHPERIQNEFWVGRNSKVGPGHARTETQPHYNSQPDQDRGGDSRADRAEVVDPLTDAESDDIHHNKDNQQQKRSSQRKFLVIRQPLVTGTKRKNGNANEVEHDRRNIHHIVSPVAPAGEKTVEVSEDFLGPEVDAAFAGVPVGKFDDRNALRPEKQQKRNNPKPDGDAAVSGNRGNDIEVKDGDDKKQNEVQASQDTAQVRRVLHCGRDMRGGRDGGLVLQWSGLLGSVARGTDKVRSALELRFR